MQIKIFDGQKQKTIIQFLSFWVLLFAISPFSYLPWGTGYRYLAYIGAPLALMVILFNASKPVFLRRLLSYFYYFFRPFLPFILGYIVIGLFFLNSHFDPEIKFNVICLTVIFNAIIFGLLASFGVKIKKEYFFMACALAGCVFVADILFTAYQNKISIWEVRPLVKPYATIYGRCIALIGGLSIIGAVYCDSISLKIKTFFIVSGILCFVTSIGVLLVRATLFVPFFALICVLLLQKRIDHKRLLISGAITVLLTTFVFIQTPLGARLERGYKETVSTVLTEDLEKVLEKTKNGEELTASEEKIKRNLNTSMGGRVAVWTLAKEERINFWIGTGLGKPEYFIDVTKLFSYSKDYLPHFHSDYVQCYVVGGIILLVSLILTELLLFVSALHSPILLYLLFSMMSYGLIDLGFLDLKAFCCFVGAWMVVAFWKLPSSHYY